MLEFYPPAPGSFNRQSEPGQPLPAVPPIPFRPTTDNNNAGEKKFIILKTYIKTFVFLFCTSLTSANKNAIRVP